MKTIAIISLLALSSVYAHAQFTVNGMVKDAEGEEISFATIRIYNSGDSIKPVIMGVSDEAGVFKMPLAVSGNFKANVSATGMVSSSIPFTVDSAQPDANLGTISLTPENALEEVTVTADRPVISREIDRIGYDVQADPDAATTQLDEILKKVPLVTVDADGNITIKGQSSFKIYKNGRPNNSFTKNAKDIFKAIPASMIKKIEVITDPGAREDAEGAGVILNIVTIENTVIRGVTGTAGINCQFPNYAIPQPFVWLTTQLDKVTVALNIGSGFRTKKWTSYSNEETIYPDGTIITNNSTDRSRDNYTYGGGEISWEIDTLNLISGEFQLWRNYDHGGINQSVESILAANPQYNYSSSRAYKSSYLDFDGNINYQHTTSRKDETLTLSYAISTTRQTKEDETEYTRFYNVNFPYNETSVDSRLRFIEQTVQFDWSRPINQYHKFDIGTKLIHRDNHTISDNNYFGTDYQRNDEVDFSHITMIGAIYADYRLKYRKIGARAGLRYEYSRLSAKFHDTPEKNFASSLKDVVPTLSFNWSPCDASTYKINYSTRIRRPGISSLNPEVVETPLTWSSGNPELKSTFIHNLSAEYSYLGPKVSLEASIFGSLSNNAVISTKWLEGDVTCSSYANGGHNRSFGARFWTNVSFGSKTKLMLNMSVTREIEKNQSLGIGYAYWRSFSYFRLEQRLPLDFTFYLTPFFSTPSHSLYSKEAFNLSSNMTLTVSLHKQLLKEKRLRVSVNWGNPFVSRKKYHYSSVNMPYESSSHITTPDSQFVSIGVSYRFGSLNAAVKKTGKSISNDDLESKKL